MPMTSIIRWERVIGIPASIRNGAWSAARVIATSKPAARCSASYALEQRAGIHASSRWT